MASRLATPLNTERRCPSTAAMSVPRRERINLAKYNSMDSPNDPVSALSESHQLDALFRLSTQFANRFYRPVSIRFVLRNQVIGSDYAPRGDI